MKSLKKFETYIDETADLINNISELIKRKIVKDYDIDDFDHYISVYRHPDIPHTYVLIYSDTKGSGHRLLISEDHYYVIKEEIDAAQQAKKYNL